ncbi:MAG: hypothetical protein EU551_02755 [Promethearchaeota archaeon]|nr:MAG: hypothetical protein EU551_02755 [Candidatus Lokiarchaeota archaeon]
MRKDNKYLKRVILLFLVSTFLFVLITVSNIVNNKSMHFQNITNPNNHKDNEKNYFINSGSITENLKSTSMELVNGNLIYDDLIQNSQFTSNNWWSFTNSTNITAQWDSDEQNAKLFHTSGISGTTKVFDQVATINQSFYKNFTTPISTFRLFWEDFESGSFLTNGWTVQSGSGTLDISTTNPYNGSRCALFAGNSQYTESTLSKTFNLDGLYNSTLSFYITSESLEANDYLSIDIYDGIWHYDLRSYTGNFGYQLETIDLRNYDHIDGFRIRFRGNLSHATYDSVRIDDIIVRAYQIPTASALLHFSYQVEQVLNSNLELRIRLWDSNQFKGTLWTTQIYNPTELVNLSIDISNELALKETYNISFEVQAQISTSSAVNFSVQYDSISLLCRYINDSSAMSYITNEKDNKSLKFSLKNEILDVRFNFSVLEGNMSIHVYCQAPVPITIWIYNFSSLNWHNLTNIQAINFDWVNITGIKNMDFVENFTHIAILRYTNSSIALTNHFQIDYQSISIETYPSNLTHIQTNPSVVQSGQTIKTQVNFTAISLSMPIEGACISTNYTEDQYICQELSNGLYNITFYTDLATPGQKIIKITAFKEGFDNSSIITSFNLTGFSSEIYFISGIFSINGTNWVDSNPFPDDQTKQIQIYYNGSFGGIPGAIIRARSNITGQLMPFQDLGNTISHIYDGYYNITLDTTSLDEYQIGRIDISVIKEGYISQSANFSFQISRIPSSYLLLETDVENITTIEGQNIQIGASFIDLFHNSLLFDSQSDGNLTWRINSTDANETHVMDKLLTVYLTVIDLSHYNVTPGVYDLIIETWAVRNYDDCFKTVRLEVLPKKTSGLTINNTPNFVLAGSEFKIWVNLSVENNDIIPLSPVTFKLKYNYRSVPTYNQITETRLTNDSGIAEILVQTDPMYKSVQIIVEYMGNNTIKNTSINSNNIPIIILNSSITLSNLPNEILEGQTLELSALLKINNTIAVNRSIIIRFYHDDIYSGDQRSASTNENGIANISYTIPYGITKISIEVIFEGGSYENQNLTTSETAVISTLTLLMRYSPIWLTILVVLIAIILGVYLNKRLLRLTKFQKDIQKGKKQITKKGKMLVSRQTPRDNQIRELLEKELPNIKIKKGKVKGK